MRQLRLSGFEVRQEVSSTAKIDKEAQNRGESQDRCRVVAGQVIYPPRTAPEAPQAALPFPPLPEKRIFSAPRFPVDTLSAACSNPQVGQQHPADTHRPGPLTTRRPLITLRVSKTNSNPLNRLFTSLTHSGVKSYTVAHFDYSYQRLTVEPKPWIASRLGYGKNTEHPDTQRIPWTYLLLSRAG